MPQPSDEQAIRELIAGWIAASKAGDTETVLGLMTEDALFLVPGEPPMRGRAAFAAAAQAGGRPFRLEVDSEVLEMEVTGDHAYLWTRLAVTVVPAEGAAPIKRQGHTLTILKQEGGRWRIHRDANLLAPVADG